MSSVLLRAASRTSKLSHTSKLATQTLSVRLGSTAVDVENLKPEYIIKFDPNDDFYFNESLRHPIPNGPRMICIPDELKCLKEAEKGDWKLISTEEQVDLYNMYFGMTIAEMSQGSDQWKSCFGIAFMMIAIMPMVMLAMKKTVLPVPDPYMTSEERLKETIAWQIKARYNPITGYPSLWDYEANDWKQ